MYWLDYSAAKLAASTIKNAGYGGVIRYIDAPDRLRTKHTNLAEYTDHISGGLQVRLVFQNTTTDADGGYAAGVANAQRAKAGADYLGYKGVIFFTNDRPTLPNVQTWRDYLRGAASVLGLQRVGAYGFNNALNSAIGYASAYWQAGRRSDLVGHANYWQDNNTQVTVGGITCDRNEVVHDYVPSDGSTSTGYKRSTELMYTYTAVKSPSTISVRVRLVGGPNAKLIIRPAVEGGVDVVWLGNVFAWGNDMQGVGGNPKNVPGYDTRVKYSREVPLANALWADVEYSCNADFIIESVG